VENLVRFALVALFPRVDDWPGLAELGVDDKIAALHRDATWLFWIGLVGAAIFFQLSPLLTLRKPLLAVWLTPDELDAHAYALGTHRSYLVRQIVMLLKLMGGLFWAESPEIRTALQLPAYPVDPGTRRIEPMITRARATSRHPVPQLVTLGRRERERGRSGAHTVASGAGEVA
jgi:hypothetical protein